MRPRIRTQAAMNLLRVIAPAAGRSGRPRNSSAWHTPIISARKADAPRGAPIPPSHEWTSRGTYKAVAIAAVTRPAAAAARASRIAGPGLLPRTRQYTQAPQNCPTMVPTMKPTNARAPGASEAVRQTHDALAVLTVRCRRPALIQTWCRQNAAFHLRAVCSEGAGRLPSRGARRAVNVMASLKLALVRCKG